MAGWPKFISKKIGGFLAFHPMTHDASIVQINLHDRHGALQPLFLPAKEKNLKNYAELKRQYQFPDLQQLAKNNRGRGETIDCALPTLTTNSGKLYSKASFVAFPLVCPFL